MCNGKGAFAPLFFDLCVPSLRADAALNMALQALECEDFATALISAEYVCRRFPTSSIAAVLRAQILQRCQPQIASKAWYHAWCIDPQDFFLQDALLDAWSNSGAKQSVLELAPLFLPARCKKYGAQYFSLVNHIAGEEKATLGVCWRTDVAIAGRVFAPPKVNGEYPKVRLLISNQDHQFAYELTADGQVFTIDCPYPNSVWSVAFVQVEQSSAPQMLYGSPLSFSAIEHRIGSPKSQALRVTQNLTSDSARNRVCILIPVYRGFMQVQACLNSVLQSLDDNKAEISVLVIDDASPEPAISKWLDDLAAQAKIILLRNTYNLGFIETVNRGLRRAAMMDADVLLLNADTLVHSNWVDRMSHALYSAADIASVTPWSNNGEISSFPKIAVNSPTPNFQQIMRIDGRVAALHESGQISDVEVPACCGFAMLMRSEVIRQIGLLDGYELIRGYSEEVDWCLRASANGYRHLVATSVFVAHAGGVSFGAEKIYRVAQNRAVIASRYPSYYQAYHQFLKEDPLQDARHLIHSTLLEDECDWLMRIESNDVGKISSLRALPAPIQGSYERIAVWENRIGSVFSQKILQLARLLATHVVTCAVEDRLVHLRLLIIGEVSEALWHTGVVDVLPSIGFKQKPLLSNVEILGFAGCREVLIESDLQVALNIDQVQVNEDFDPAMYLDNWKKR